MDCIERCGAGGRGDAAAVSRHLPIAQQLGAAVAESNFIDDDGLR